MRPFLIAVFLLTGAVLRGEENRYTFTERHMGTKFQIIVYAASEKIAKDVTKSAFARVAALNRIMSDYDRNSELMRLCRTAHQRPIKVSADLFHVLHHAQRLSRQTEGAFDITIGPITRSWRVARKRLELPEKKDLALLIKKVGFQKIKLHPKERAVSLAVSEMRLDLGGIAKGYTADEALKTLNSKGISRALVAAGGDIVVGDAPPDKKGWRVGIAPLTNPEGRPTKYLLLKNQAVSTSGDAEQFIQIGERRYSHIVDPRTGIGVEGQFSVTVIAPRGIESDSLATALSILDQKTGLKLIQSRKQTEVLIIRKVNNRRKSLQSKGFVNHLID